VVARKYELSGAGIINVVQSCCLEALDRGDAVIGWQDILRGVRKEFMKEGRILQ
jgi:hypothetical protein